MHGARDDRSRHPLPQAGSAANNAWEQQDYKTAAEMAEIALPYTTPRLAATTITQRNALDELSLDDLQKLLALAEAAAAQERVAVDGMREENAT